MHRTRFAWAALILIVALSGVAWISYSQVPPEEQGEIGTRAEAPIPGYVAPGFSLLSLGGETVSLEDFRGQPVIINFWATWCPPCRAEIPHFQDASVKYEGRLTILGIDQGEPQAVVSDFASTFGMTYPILLDSNSDVNRSYSVSALPTTVFVDSNGLVDEVYAGIVNLAVLEDRIEELLEE